MEYRTVIMLGILFITIGFLLVIDEVEGKTITVEYHGEGDYKTIQDAINSSEDGDTIRVFKGHYYGPVIVNKSVNLIGNGTGITQIFGDHKGDVVRITADWVNMSGFTVQYSENEAWFSGIHVLSNHTLITENVCDENANGIYLESSSDCIVMNNTCTSNTFHGIKVRDSRNVTILNNICTSNQYFGIGIRSFINSTISYNNCSRNDLDGIFQGNSTGCIITYNICSLNGGRGIYIGASYSTISNNIGENNEYGIVISDSNYLTIENNDCLANNDRGISLFSSNNCTIMSNTISGNKVGISLRGSSQDNIAHYNEIYNNIEYGINASENNDIFINATSNWWGNDSGPYHPTLNPTGKGDNVTDNVIFEPWIREPIIWYIDDDAPGGGDGSLEHPFNQIQDAINASFDGDTIRVFEGNYIENVRVNKSVSLIGNGSEVTIIDGNGNGDVVTIYANWVNISGFHVTGSQYDAGIGVESDNNHIFKNNCSYNRIGIRLSSSSKNILESNTCSLNDGSGIKILLSPSNTIINNTANSNRWIGIDLYGSSNNIIINNTVDSNSNYGIRLDSSVNNTLTNNTVNSNSNYGIFLSSSDNTTITDNTANSNDDTGIFIKGSSNINTITNNTANSNTFNGIYLLNSNNNTLTDNTCSNNWVGIDLHASNNNTLTNNTASDNGEYGIHLVSSYSNTLTNTTANANNYGIRLDSSSDCTLRNNTCSGNNIGMYFGDSGNNTITKNTCENNNDHGIFLLTSSNCTLRNNICENNNEAGIYLSYSSGCTITNNICSSNIAYGIWLRRSSNNTFESNSCSLNDNYGIHIYRSNDCIITNNTFSENRVGINLVSSFMDNIVHNNFIIENTEFGINAIENDAILINATNNWWGDNSGPYHETNNPSGKGDNVTDNVIFDPWIGKMQEPMVNRTWYVDDDAPLGGDGSLQHPYRRIQDAIDNATEFDVIRVFEGTYNELVVVDRTVKLIGNGSEETSITGWRSAGGIVELRADGIMISGFMVSHELQYKAHIGIYVPSNNCIIRENTISNAYHGIYLDNCSGVTVKNNACLFNKNEGVYIESSNNCTITSNTCENNNEGIRLESSSNCTIMDNTCSSNNRDGIYLLDSSNSIIEHNTCSFNSNHGICLNDSIDCTITSNIITSNNDEGINLNHSKFGIITNNICSNNNIGIYLDDSGNSIIKNNTCENNWGGIYLHDIHHNLIKQNTCSSNSNFGISLNRTSNSLFRSNTCSFNNNFGITLVFSSDLSINSNTISENGIGISMQSYSQNNTVHRNNIFNNSYLGIDATQNKNFTVDSNQNWWGDSSGPYHPKNNSHGLGDNITDNVLFEPWLDENGNLVYLPDVSEDDEPNNIPLYILLGLLAALFSTLAITVRTPGLGSVKKVSQGPAALSSWDSSDVVNIKGKMITCEHCHQGFDVAKNEKAIRVPCPNCGRYTLNS